MVAEKTFNKSPGINGINPINSNLSRGYPKIKWSHKIPQDKRMKSAADNIKKTAIALFLAYFIILPAKNAAITNPKI